MTTAPPSPSPPSRCSPGLICIARGQRTDADLTQPDNEGDNGDQADDRRPSRDGGPPLLEHGPAMIVKPATAANAELFTSVHAVPVDGGTLPANDAVIHETVVPKEQAEQECLSPDRVGHVLRAAASAAAEPAPDPALVPPPGLAGASRPILRAGLPLVRWFLACLDSSRPAGR